MATHLLKLFALVALLAPSIMANDFTCKTGTPYCCESVQAFDTSELSALAEAAIGVDDIKPATIVGIDCVAQAYCQNEKAACCTGKDYMGFVVDSCAAAPGS